MSLFRKKKKTEERQSILLCPGVTLAEAVSMGDVTPGQDTLVKGLAEALIVFGGLGGFLSCFGVSYYVPVVAVSYLLMAAYFSYLFKTGKALIRDIGYVVFFIVFVLGIMAFHDYINSGFYAVVNIIYEEASDYFDMPAVREFTEVVANRDLTVTLAAIFIGSAEIIILNIYLSTYMSVTAAIVISVPLFIVPLFFEKEPDSFYMILLFAGLFSVVILKSNGHYKRNRNNLQFEYFKKRHGGMLKYSQSGRVVAELIMGVTMVCLLIISACNLVYPKDVFSYRFKSSSLKASIEDSVENVMLTGILSLFDFYGNTSGMSGGKLGGVSSIRSDYQPDLKVRFTPYSYNTLYLKGFTGEYYDTNHWSKDADGLFEIVESSDAKGIMEVENVGADNGYLYMPYYAEMDDTSLLRYQNSEGIQRWDSETYTYFPDLSYGVLAENGEDKLQISFSSQEAVKDSYLDVPEANYDVIAAFCKNAGFEGNSQEIISQVILYFQENIPYTLRPGSMPRNADFVNYFLEKNKKGYCAHFASAATLIFRYYGIPARYVEGYAIPYTQVMDGELVEGAEYADYFTGKSGMLGETAVVEVTATDANAHAWVEVYLDGAWQVVEVTPSSDEEDIEDFWSIFGNLLSGGDSEGVEGQSSGNTFSLDRFTWIWKLMLGVLAAFFVVLAGRFMWKKGRRILGYHGRDEILNIIMYYKYLCDIMRMTDADFYLADSHYRQLVKMCPEDTEALDLAELANALEQISYSSDRTDVNAEQIMRKLKYILKRMKKNMQIVQKVNVILHL